MVHPHQTSEVKHDKWLIFKGFHYGMDSPKLKWNHLVLKNLVPSDKDPIEIHELTHGIGVK